MKKTTHSSGIKILLLIFCFCFEDKSLVLNKQWTQTSACNAYELKLESLGVIGVS